MILKKISLVNFKNYAQLDASFSKKINCLVGDNGAGKSNFFDAIYYLSFCKSFINPIDSQNIKYEKDFFVIQGQYLNNDTEENIYCGIKKGSKKVFKRNKKEYKKLVEHIGLIPLVFISPFDSNLIYNGSEERRKFMDGVISQTDKEYLSSLIDYNRSLLQRNQILKKYADQKTIAKDLLDVWDEKLVGSGNEIYRKRKLFTENFIPVFQDYYSRITGNIEKVNLNYKSQLFDTDFKNLLALNRNKDAQLQYTCAGIHRDDLEFLIQGHSLRKSGSQGQQKTFLTALKLAQYQFLKKIREKTPILLLDDIFDKLDNNRVHNIMVTILEKSFGQVFISDKNKKHIDEILNSITKDYDVFLVKKGELKQFS